MRRFAKAAHMVTLDARRAAHLGHSDGAEGLPSRATTRATDSFDIYMPTQGMADIQDGVRACHRPAAASTSAFTPRTSAAASACATRSIRNSSR